ILPKTRRPKSELLVAFQLEQGRLLGALANALAHGLKTLPTVTNSDWPRMADFAKFATACEGAFTTPGAFKDAYERNRTDAIEAQLGDDPVAAAVLKLALPWDGQATALLTQLRAIADQAQIHPRDLPKDAKALSRRLHRLQPLLREKGITARDYRTKVARGWTLEVLEPGENPDLSSRTSLRPTGPQAYCGLLAADAGDHERGADNIVTCADLVTGRKANTRDDREKGDDSSGPLSNGDPGRAAL